MHIMPCIARSATYFIGCRLGWWGTLLVDPSSWAFISSSQDGILVGPSRLQASLVLPDDSILPSRLQSSQVLLQELEDKPFLVEGPGTAQVNKEGIKCLGHGWACPGPRGTFAANMQ